MGQNQCYHFGAGEFTHFGTYFSGDWDVHWGYDLDFDPWPLVDSPKCKQSARIGGIQLGHLTCLSGTWENLAPATSETEDVNTCPNMGLK